MLLSLLIYCNKIIFNLKKKTYSLSIYAYFLTLHLSWIYYFDVIIVVDKDS